jgi:hypothetical protein
MVVKNIEKIGKGCKVCYSLVKSLYFFRPDIVKNDKDEEDSIPDSGG